MASSPDQLDVRERETNVTDVEEPASAELRRASPQPEPSDKELWWRQYALLADLHKHYLDQLIKLNAFYYAVAGGVLSFYFGSARSPTMRYALLFPMLMSLAFGALALYSSQRVKYLVKEAHAAKRKLGFGTIPDIGLLTFLLIISGVLFGIGYVVLTVVFALSYVDHG